MIDVSEFIKDKTTWKICESVRLGLDSVYLTFSTLCDAGDEFMTGREQGIYSSFEKVSRVVYRFTLTDKVAEDYRKDVLPKLPYYWWFAKQPWMEF